MIYLGVVNVKLHPGMITENWLTEGSRNSITAEPASTTTVNNDIVVWDYVFMENITSMKLVFFFPVTGLVSVKPVIQYRVFLAPQSPNRLLADPT